MAKKLMSFRLAPDLASFLVQQSEVLGVSTTELVNRLLRWAVQNVPQGFFQAASLATGNLDINNPSADKKEPPPIDSQKPLPTADVQSVPQDDSAVIEEYAQIQKAMFEKLEQISNDLKEQLSDEMERQLSNFREEYNDNSRAAEDTGKAGNSHTLGDTGKTLVGNGNTIS